MPARKTCADPQCPEMQPCPVHAKKPWEGSTRRERTVSGWEQQARARRVMKRHDAICHVCNEGGADEVDHPIPLAEGGSDDERDLRPIHSVPCHREKSRRESARARSNA